MNTPVGEKIGILLTNTGSPDAPTTAALRPYLAQFLTDPRVIEYPRWLWLPLLYGVILIIRPRRSARLYRRIWTTDGSPMLSITHQQAKLIRDKLSNDIDCPFELKIGMRYGKPSISLALRELRQEGIGRLLVFPLFPQYSATTIASAFDAVFAELRAWRWMPALRTIRGYHNHPAYLHALGHSILRQWQKTEPSRRLLFSFHGIPQSYAEAGDPYPRQCQETAARVAVQLGLTEDQWQVAFQSRFGPQSWLQPYTDALLEQWARDGIESVSVFCPGFAADCLETLGEIGHEARQTFLASGGKEFQYIPALNTQAEHIQALNEIILTNLSGWVGF